MKFTRITDAEMTTQEEEEEEESLTLKRTKKIKIKRTFDFSKYKTRKIALELAYCGANHFGFSSQGCVQASSDNTTNAKNSHIRTIEGALFEALKKCRLVDPSKEIFGEPSVDYSRCGRTDRGVSSIGNVVSLNVRCKGVGAAAEKTKKTTKTVKTERRLITSVI